MCCKWFWSSLIIYLRAILGWWLRLYNILIYSKSFLIFVDILVLLLEKNYRVSCSKSPTLSYILFVVPIESNDWESIFSWCSIYYLQLGKHPKSFLHNSPSSLSMPSFLAFINTFEMVEAIKHKYTLKTALRFGSGL